jgi:hypothetical protein
VSGWTFTLRSADSGINPATWPITSDLTGATARKIRVFLDQPAEIEFSINAEHDEAALVQELLCDVVASHDAGDGLGPEAVLRGRVGSTADTGDGTRIDTTVKAVSYRGLLHRKILYSADSVLTYADPTLRIPEDIAWELIAAAQGRTNGTWGITRGTPAATSSTTRTQPFEAGMVVGEQIDQVAAGTFDWDVGPDLVYMTYYPQRGRSSGQFPLDYGGSVASFTRNFDPADYANAVRVSGGTPSGGSPPTPQGLNSSEVGSGTARQGRWEVQISDQDLLAAGLLLIRATKEVNERQVITPSYSMTLTPGMWRGPNDLWIGDVAPVQIRAGRLDVSVDLRVLAMEFALSDDTGVGDEADQVTVTLGKLAPHQAYLRRWRKQLEDVARLGRR